MSQGKAPSEEMSFWDHLEVLRGTLFRSLVAVALFTVVIFCLKGFVFEGIILAPARADFFLYRLLGIDFSMQLVNIDLTAQFFIHLKTSIALGFILSFPYICYEVWKFIAPALYDNERKTVRGAFLFAGGLFYLGVAVGYAIVLPVTLNFFEGYSVSDSVANTISLQSYISLFTSMVLMFGIVFEFPTVILVLSKFGLITKQTLRKYRRHAVVVILILAAIITPADPFSMFVAALPLYLLYEGSVLVCKSGDEEDDDGDGEAAARAPRAEGRTGGRAKRKN